MPRILLFEDTNRIFLHSSNGRLKVLFEDNSLVFMHNSEVDPKCICEGKVENCICKDLDFGIRIKNDSSTELLQVSGWYHVDQIHARCPGYFSMKTPVVSFCTTVKKALRYSLKTPIVSFCTTVQKALSAVVRRKLKTAFARAAILWSGQNCTCKEFKIVICQVDIMLESTIKAMVIWFMIFIGIIDR